MTRTREGYYPTSGTMVAKWAHRGGSVVHLFAMSASGWYSVHAPGAGGTFHVHGGDGAAIALVEGRMADGWYSRDAWTTGYVRVTSNEGGR
jgi:hypothetical protein